MGSPSTSAAAAASLLGSGFPSPFSSSEYSNLAYWNSLTPAQRLLLTQQFKGVSPLLGAANAKSAFPPFPSLPLDTDLKTMLDYNPHKTAANTNSPFTRPSVPPLISVNSLNNEKQSKSSKSQSSSSSTSSVPLSSSALEDFEKISKFKMTDEMKAVVQKVLSNPDLSTFIQTNASNTFVPFISPPISPATGNLNHNSTSISLVSNPNVTITPQLPGHFSQPGLAHSPSARQKSVICSTGAMNVPPSPSNSNSTATPSPSPTRLGGGNAAVIASNAHKANSSAYSCSAQHQFNNNHYNNTNASPNTTTTPMEVIDLSSSRRSLQAASAFLQQQQQGLQAHQAAAVAAAAQAQAQQQRMAAAAAQHHQNGRSSSSSSSNSASMHLQRHAAMAAANAGAVDNQRLCIIPEIGSSNNNMVPYRVQRVYVENQVVPCINMKAYNDSEQLMTLNDFQKSFFPNVPLDLCKRIIEALGIEMYKGNR